MCRDLGTGGICISANILIFSVDEITDKAWMNVFEALLLSSIEVNFDKRGLLLQTKLLHSCLEDENVLA